MSRLSFVIASVALLAASAPALADSHWPEFRGPRGDGTSNAVGLPTSFGEKHNAVWMTPIHDRGWSTPVVWGSQVWLTTAAEDGKKMYAVAVDRETGKVLHDKLLFEVEKPEPLGNPVNCYASPSPAIEEGRVYIHFGSYGTACLDSATGATIWERRDLPCRHFRGPGSSPIFFRDFLILTMDGFDYQYLCALNKKTGRTVWKTDRSYPWDGLDGDLRKAYTTPLVVEDGGVLELLSCGAKAAYSYDPVTGRELWQVRYQGFSNASRPVYGNGLAFINTGFGKADLWAMRLGGKGLLTDKDMVWKCTQGVPLKPSPILSGDYLYLVADPGFATCLEAKTGTVVWKERLGGTFSASPLISEGKIYAPGEDGTVFVFEAGRKFKLLAANRFPQGFLSSPAAADSSLFLRSKTHLYRFDDRKKATEASGSEGR